jgi:hypothetical protein
MGGITIERRGAEARVRWALRFRHLDLARCSERARHRAWAALVAWQTGRPAPGTRPTADGVPETQQALRECVEALAQRLPDMVWMPETGWAIFPPRRPGEPITRVQSDPGGGRLTPAAVVFQLVDDLNAIGAHRLRACPLETNGQPCGVIFLATRRQRFCSRRHAVADAQKRYEPKRKARRRDY